MRKCRCGKIAKYAIQDFEKQTVTWLCEDCFKKFCKNNLEVTDCEISDC